MHSWLCIFATNTARPKLPNHAKSYEYMWEGFYIAMCQSASLCAPAQAFNNVKYLVTEKMGKVLIMIVDKQRSLKGICGY